MSDRSAYESIDPPLTSPAGERFRDSQPIAIRIHTFGRYGVTRLILWLVTLIGWLFVLAGIVALILAIAGFADRTTLASNVEASVGVSVGVFLTLLGVGTMVSGLLGIAFAQNVRANIDTADYARQSLVLQKAIAEGLDEIDTNRMPNRPVNDLASDL